MLGIFFAVKIISPDKSEELSYRGKCLPLDIPKEKLSAVGRCLIFTDITAKQFWGNLRIHYSVEVHPNPKAKGNSGGQKNAPGNLGNAKPSPKPKKSQQGQANASTQSQHVNAQQAQVKSSSPIPDNEEPANSQDPGGNSITSQPQSPTSLSENVSVGGQNSCSPNTTSNSGEANGSSIKRDSPVNDNTSCNNKSRGSQTERSPETPNSTGAAEARESAC